MSTGARARRGVGLRGGADGGPSRPRAQGRAAAAHGVGAQEQQQSRRARQAAAVTHGTGGSGDQKDSRDLLSDEQDESHRPVHVKQAGMAGEMG